MPERSRRSRSSSGRAAAEPSSPRSTPAKRTSAERSPAGRSSAERSPAKRGRRRSRSLYAAEPQPQLTSLPTHRGAYVDTRHWLLDRHGPVCAYCGRRTDPSDITLDHVTPRRGLSAYDRRDNLVLACTRCNGVKADKPILVFLLAQRERAANMLRYGQHLSPMLVDLATQVAGPEAAERAARLADPDYPYAD
jgi:5-methylcytosine-specific restriction endonuclease McrA